MRRGPGLIGTAARAGVAGGVAGRVQHRQQQKWAAQEQGTQEPAAAVPPAAPGAGASDYTDELVKLAQLRDQGVISTQDFEAKKKQLLGI